MGVTGLGQVTKKGNYFGNLLVACASAGGNFTVAGVTKCTDVANAADPSAVTCTNATNSQMTGNCTNGYTKNTAGDADACDANPCDVSAAPANGAVGGCNSTLASGSTCQPTCDTGYTVYGASSCTAGTLTPATCTKNPTTTTTAKPVDHDDHDHSPSPGVVDGASTISPAFLVTVATL